MTVVDATSGDPVPFVVKQVDDQTPDVDFRTGEFGAYVVVPK
jgi:hypothetical protein